MITLYGLTEFAREIGLTGPNARIEMSQLHRRGKLPEPYAKAGNRPLWTWEQVQEYRYHPKAR